MEILIPRFSFLLWIVGLVNNSVLMVLSSSVAIQDGHHLHLITANLLTFEPRISVPPESSPEGKPRRLCDAQPPSLSRDVRGFQMKDSRRKPSRRGGWPDLCGTAARRPCRTLERRLKPESGIGRRRGAVVLVARRGTSCLLNNGRD